jgi:uncharacterized protein (TIGR02266 family)
MSDQYWICDPEGRVLGPLPLQTVTELVAAGRIRTISAVSRDGEDWVTVDQVPEVVGLFQAPEPNAREREEAQKAVQLRGQLAALQGKLPYEVLGVRSTATLDEHRSAFFALAKRFHPARLPPGTHPQLREACFETFQFLSGLMQGVENTMAPRPVPPPPPAATERRRPPIQPPQRPTYEVSDFVGLTRGGDGIEATVRVTPRTASIFTEHHTVNFNNESVFLPTRQHLPLGTVLSVHLIFDNAKEIHSRARVVWENAAETNRTTKLGFGVRLLSLEKHDRQFIKDYLNQVPREPPPGG